MEPILHDRLDGEYIKALNTHYSGEYEMWLEERIEELEGVWLEAKDRCPQCGTGNYNLINLQIRADRLQKALEEVPSFGPKIPTEYHYIAKQALENES